MQYTDVIADIIKKRTAEHLPIAALFTDLDETFQLKGFEAITEQIFALCREHSWLLVIATGNGFTGVLPRIIAKQFPPPDIIIANVGTDIWVRTGHNQYVQDQAYQQKINQSGFNRLVIAKRGQIVVEKLKEQQPEASFTFQRPEPEAAFMRGEEVDVEAYKVSFYFDAKDLKKVEDIRIILQENFPSEIITISEHSTYNRALEPAQPKRYCADVLPINKAGAVNYLVELLDIQAGIVAGDSGNDVDMLLNTSSQLQSVLVGGAKSEAIAAIKDTPSKKVCYDDSASGRVGPESILYTMQHYAAL